MPDSKLNMWPYLQYYLEDEYAEVVGVSPYVENSDSVLTYEYVKWVADNNAEAIGEVGEDDLRGWYDAEVKPMLEMRRAPEIKDMLPRVINVYFIREYKFFFNKNNKKNPADYVLNIDKIVDEKTSDAPPVIFNNVQIFMLNYEIKKLLDKAITITNEKYYNIVYINGKMTQDGILNVIGHLEKTYKDYHFNYVLLDRETEFDGITERCNKINVVKSLF